MNKEFIICKHRGRIEISTYGYYLYFPEFHHISVYNIAKNLYFPVNRQHDVKWDIVFHTFNLEKLMIGNVKYTCVFPEFEILEDLLTFCNFLVSYDLKLHKFIDLNALL